MNYTELVFSLNMSEDYHRDLVIDALAGIGYDTFEDTDKGFKTYIPSNSFDQSLLDKTLLPFHETVSLSYEINQIPSTNWNAIWESNFTPILIKDQCYVRATFHAPHPEYPYEIVIDPKMSFGTGHHQTTALMIECMLEENFTGKTVLDMGCGTGILSILASRSGAKSVLAVDYDPVCTGNTFENAQLNNTANISVLTGSKDVLPAGQSFNIVLANINRNILLDQMETYSKVLAPRGFLLISGFYLNPDLDILTEKAKQFALSYIYHRSQDEWTLAKFVKESIL
jgi:ribosomal protein L11 methyltransferase